MKIHLSKSEVIVKDGKVIIVTLSKQESSCGRKEQGYRNTGSKSNKGNTGSIMISNYSSFSNYTERCSHCTIKYNELILKARELKNKGV